MNGSGERFLLILLRDGNDKLRTTHVNTGVEEVFSEIVLSGSASKSRSDFADTGFERTACIF
jgi:hypothetical protein